MRRMEKARKRKGWCGGGNWGRVSMEGHAEADMETVLTVRIMGTDRE